MKSNKCLAFLAGLLIMCGLLASPAETANATSTRVSEVTKSFSGFASGKSALTKGMKIKISKWVKLHPGYRLVSCKGFTGIKAKKRYKASLQKIAIARAKSVCNYIAATKGGIAIHSTKAIPGNGRTASAKKVSVTLITVKDTGNESGSGVIAIGLCDSSLSVTMQSRISSGEFYFSRLTVFDISTNCNGQVLDIYLLDKDGNQLASSLDNRITETWFKSSYTSFTPADIPSDKIKQVAIEIRRS